MCPILVAVALLQQCLYRPAWVGGTASGEWIYWNGSGFSDAQSEHVTANNDTIIGGGGNNTFLFAKGDGGDAIYEAPSTI